MSEHKDWSITQFGDKWADWGDLSVDKGRERHILGYRRISRNSRINKGISFGADHEGIVIDDEKDEVISGIFNEVDILFKNELNRNKGALLRLVFQKTQERLPYNDERGQYWRNEFKDKILYLGQTIDDGGVCRHQGLLAAYLIEKCINSGYLNGKVSFDRRKLPVHNASHAWARYTTSTGEVIIIDPSRKRIEQLSEMSDDDKKIYTRPEVPQDIHKERSNWIDLVKRVFKRKQNS